MRLRRVTTALASLLILAFVMLPAFPVAAVASNLMANPSVETAISSTKPANWTVDNWGTNTASLSYATTGHTGNHSLLTSVSSYTNGDAKWIPDAVNVTPNQSYIYSEYYESSTATELDAQYTSTAGVVSYAYLTAVPASTSTSTWTPISTSFTVPAGTATVSVESIIASKGTLQTDDFSLTTTATVTPPTIGNLIPNPSFETANGGVPANWQTGSWGANSASFSYGTTGHTGSHSATVSMSSYTSGDAKWYASPVAVTAGQTYTYSDYYQANVPTSLVAVYTTSAGVTSYVNMPDATTATTWTQYSTNLTIPSGITSLTVYHLIDAVGSLTIDDVSLTAAKTVTPTPTPTPSPAPTSTNLVANNTVETVDPSNSAAPLDWSADTWGTNTTSFSYLTTGGHTGNRAISTTVSSYTSGDSKWVFNPVTVTPDTQYVFSDYYKATVATEVDVAFNMSDGTTVYQIIGLPEAATSWTNFSTTFTVPLGAETMSVYHLIHSVGTLTIDDANLKTYTPVGFKRAMISLTFDDGYDNMYTQALPILQKDGFLSTDYIITGDINTAGYMTNAQVKALAQDGEEIGSHTVTHDDMLTETAAQYDSELSQSKAQLQSWTGETINNLAFPNGLYNKAITTDTAKYYTTARGVEDGLNSKDNYNIYDIKVQNLYNTTTTAQVADWVKQAQATNTWLVLVYHSVDPTGAGGSVYNVTPTQLTDQLATVKSSGIAVETMQQAEAEIAPQL